MGWSPAGHRVWVLPDVQPDRIGSLFVPEAAKQRREVENVEGVIIKIGTNAWKAFDDGRPWAKVGDRISCAKYAGFVKEVTDKDGNKTKYQVINDEDVVLVWEEE